MFLRRLNHEIGGNFNSNQGDMLFSGQQLCPLDTVAICPQHPESTPFIAVLFARKQPQCVNLIIADSFKSSQMPAAKTAFSQTQRPFVARPTNTISVSNNETDFPEPTA